MENNSRRIKTVIFFNNCTDVTPLFETAVLITTTTVLMEKSAN